MPPDMPRPILGARCVPAHSEPQMMLSRSIRPKHYGKTLIITQCNAIYEYAPAQSASGLDYPPL